METQTEGSHPTLVIVAMVTVLWPLPVRSWTEGDSSYAELGFYDMGYTFR